MRRAAGPFRTTLLAAAVAGGVGLSSNAVGAVEDYLQRAPQGYVTDGAGNVIIGGNGQCVTSGTWTREDAIERCHPNLVAQAPEPRQVVRRITLDADTTFGFDDATLTEQGKQDLDRIVEAVKDTQQPTIQVAGYADRIGPEAYNEELSRRRAEAVKDYLVSKGVSANIIQTAGRGEGEPVVTCEGLTGQDLIQCLRPNRRSEVEFAAFEVVEEEQPMQREQQPREEHLQQQMQQQQPNGTAIE